MSHRIIISSEAVSIPEGATAVETVPVTYHITYTPSHDLTPAQVGNKVEKILKLAAKMNEE